MVLLNKDIKGLLNPRKVGGFARVARLKGLGSMATPQGHFLKRDAPSEEFEPFCTLDQVTTIRISC